MKKWEVLKDYLLLLTGTLLTALAFNFFLIPHKIAPGNKWYSHGSILCFSYTGWCYHAVAECPHIYNGR